MKPITPVRLAPRLPAKPARIKARLPIDIEAPDPLGHLESTSDIEADSAADIGAIAAGFRERAKQEAERFKTATATDYYTCLVFQSGEQLTAFLRAVGVGSPGDMFIDGLELADRLGVELPKASVPTNISSKIDPKLARLTGIPKPV